MKSKTVFSRLPAITPALAALLFLLAWAAGFSPAAAQGKGLAPVPRGATRQPILPSEFVPGEAIVAYRPGVTAAQARRIETGLGAVAVRSFARPGVNLLRLPGGLSTDSAVRALAANPAVAFAQPNFVYRASLEPDDPRYAIGDLWAMNNTGQNGGISDADIDAPEAWSLSTGSAGAVVAVVDTGVDYTHPDLAANMWINTAEASGAPGVDDDGNGYVDDVHGWDAFASDGDPRDGHNHGTHVAGTIGAVGNNALGVVGVNWSVSIMALRFLGPDGSGTTAGAIACLDYAHRMKDRGVNIVATNNSWGGGGFDTALKSAIDQSLARGILFVAAAGNNGTNNDASPSYPASYDSANIVAVAATTRSDGRASFSNYGASSVDLGAPGAEIWSTVRGGGYDVYSGTSMATPHVTGAAALLKAYDPALDYAQIKDRLLNTGDPISALSGKTVTGRRLNLHNALTNYSPPAPSPSPTALQVDVFTTDAYFAIRSDFRFGETIYMWTFVADSATGEGIGGVPVKVELTTASGKKYVGNGTTDSTGTIIFSHRPRRSDGKGTYRVVSTATLGSASGAGSATFTVR